MFTDAWFVVYVSFIRFSSETVTVHPRRTNCRISFFGEILRRGTAKLISGGLWQMMSPDNLINRALSLDYPTLRSTKLSAEIGTVKWQRVYCQLHELWWLSTVWLPNSDVLQEQYCNDSSYNRYVAICEYKSRIIILLKKKLGIWVKCRSLWVSQNCYTSFKIRKKSIE